MIGKTFGKFTVIALSEKVKTNSKWVIKCNDCGTERTANGSNVIKGLCACSKCGKKLRPVKMDMIGKNYGKLTVINFVAIVNKKSFWKVRCKCGFEKDTTKRQILVGSIPNCNCDKDEMLKDKMKSLCGKKFGRWTVIGFCKKKKDHYYWSCVCDCGKEGVVEHGLLKSGHSKSCGCYSAEVRLKHGQATKDNRSSEYRTWSGMIQRCENSLTKEYKNYGARGIKICEEWRTSFETFFSDMGKKPSSKHTLDRFPDNDGNYEPSNCRWATWAQQRRNMRTNHWIEFNGEKMVAADWAATLNVSANTVIRHFDNSTFDKLIQSKIHG